MPKILPLASYFIYFFNRIKIAIAKNINKTPITIKAIFIRLVMVELLEF